MKTKFSVRNENICLVKFQNSKLQLENLVSFMISSYNNNFKFYLTLIRVCLVCFRYNCKLNVRGAFRTQSSIYDGVFFEKIGNGQKPATLLKKWIWQMFSCKFSEIFKDNSLQNTSGRLLLEQVPQFARKKNNDNFKLELKSISIIIT